MAEDSTRLSKLLAIHLGVGRRQADLYIEQGRVTRNGKTAVLGERGDPSDTITLDGKPLTLAQSPVFTYLLLNKPPGYVCSRRQQGDAPTIYALLPDEYHNLQPVGRLDKDSSGLLMLTNDGDTALRMTHPRFAKTKQYEIALDAPLAPLHRQMISDHGIALPDGISKLQLERMTEGDDRQWRVVMHEGRNRQIRRTFSALGYTVGKLHRTAFGAYQLQDLPAGQWQAIPAPSI